jgi:Fe-S cluster biogenesis protein NfuA
MIRVNDVDLTPNPQALKFILSERLLHWESRQFSNVSEAENDPFAKGIFAIAGVESVFYTDKFVTIEKNKDVQWGKIQRPFIEFIESFDSSLLPAEKDAPQISDAEADLLLKKINEFLNQRVRPALAGDGGGLEVIGLDGYVLKIKYQGACGSCPSAISGTLGAIENLLRQAVDPNIEVIPA